MKCISVQRRLLGCEDPAAPPAALAAHLQECEACRGWQQRLLEMERHIPLLPVPSATAARTRLLEKVLSPPPVAPAPVVRPLVPRPGALPSPRERALQKLSLALALAAALLLFALGWWAVPRNDSPDVAPPPSVARPTLAQTLQDRLQERLASARAPRERVNQLADLADEVERQARDDKSDRSKLPVYAHFYGELVREHLLRDARTLPVAERRSLEAIAGRLRRVESEAQRLAADPAQQETASCWRDIALAADDGARRLSALARGERA